MKNTQEKKPIWTHAFDVLVKCLLSPELLRRDVHATADGFRAVVDYGDQSYEVLVKPLYKYTPTPEGVCDECKGNQRVHDTGIWTKICPSCEGSGKVDGNGNAS